MTTPRSRRIDEDRWWCRWEISRASALKGSKFWVRLGEAVHAHSRRRLGVPRGSSYGVARQRRQRSGLTNSQPMRRSRSTASDARSSVDRAATEGPNGTLQRTEPVGLVRCKAFLSGSGAGSRRGAHGGQQWGSPSETRAYGGVLSCHRTDSPVPLTPKQRGARREGRRLYRKSCGTICPTLAPVLVQRGAKVGNPRHPKTPVVIADCCIPLQSADAISGSETGRSCDALVDPWSSRLHLPRGYQKHPALTTTRPRPWVARVDITRVAS
jgi:hypothetical protein